MSICSECHFPLNNPIKLSCHHIICFLCIVPFDACPDCLCQIEHYTYINTANYKKYLWLYSSNYGDLWWCYDPVSNIMIENIFQVHSAQQETKNDTAEEQSDITIKFAKVKATSANKKTTNDTGEDFKTIKMNDSSLYVNFDNEDELVTNDEDKNEENNEEPVLPKHNQEVSYCLKINDLMYKMDMDEMQQINIQEPWRKRKIKRIVLDNHFPQDMGNLDNITAYLTETYNVTGSYGLKF
jgi:hypothetical protein